MFTSIRARLWLSYAFLIATALGVSAVVMVVFLWRNPLLYRQTLARLRTIETGIVNRQGEVLSESSMSTALERAATTFDVRILLYDDDGSLLIDTQSSQPAIPLSRNTMIGRNIPTVRDSNGGVWLFTRKALNDGKIMVVATPRPRLPIFNILRDDLSPIFFQGGIIALLLSLALAFGIARWVADPLQQVVAASQDIPSVETQPVPERGPREVRELTRAFNDMVARVLSSQRAQRDFVANVSHELKTPLTSIQGFAQAILDGTADTVEHQQQAAGVIYKESGRMYRMVLDLLDLARLDAGIADLEMVPVDLMALVQSIVEKFLLQAQKAGVTLITDGTPELPPLVADGDRLAQVLTNLVDNALKHTPAGGQVTLQTQAGKENIEIRVADTGKGISPDALPHIFERFYRGDSARSGGQEHGTGLGLAIVHQIVLAHGGRIMVRSKEGQGTTFIVYLPRVQPNATTLLMRTQ